MVVQEVVDCELVYVNNLKTLRDRYQIPLSRKRGVKAGDVAKIFNNLEAIIQLHEGVIYKELKAAYDDGKAIAPVFTKHSAWFGIYAQYLQNYNAACDTLFHLRKKKSVKAYINELRYDDETKERKYQDIVSYMIMPCQRISRYALLLGEMKKYSFPEEDPRGYSELSRAYECVKKVATQNELYQKASENVSRLLELNGSIRNLSISIFDPTRKLIKEGALNVEILDSKGADVAESHHELQAQLDTPGVPSKFYLFTDMVIWTDEKNGFLGSAPLEGAELKDESSGGDDRAVAVTLRNLHLARSDKKRHSKHKSKTICCRFRLARDRSAWVDTWRKAISELWASKDAVRARRGMSEGRRGSFL